LKGKTLSSDLNVFKTQGMSLKTPIKSKVSSEGREYNNIISRLRKAGKKVSPVWPLERFVAVNPYLGLTDQKFENAAQRLAAAGGIQMTLPASFYLQKIKEGVLKRSDLHEVLKKRGVNQEVNSFISDVEANLNRNQDFKKVLTVAEVAGNLTGKDWKRFTTGRISSWAASYFDNGQAIWAVVNRRMTPFEAWKSEAVVDRTPEIAGLKTFRSIVKSMPDHPLEAAQIVLDTLGVPEEGVDIYLHSLVLQLGGWAAYASQLDWDNELYGGKDGILIEFIAVLLCWEYAIYESQKSQGVEIEWKSAKEVLRDEKTLKELDVRLSQNLILQAAFDLSRQSEIIRKFEKGDNSKIKTTDRALAQAVFCIDVRSEVFRRNLEETNEKIETIGFAGFFAFPINFVPLAHDQGEAQCPVLLPTGPTIMEEISDKKENERAIKGRVLKRQVEQVWKSFKSGAVTCFSFVSPIGMSYLPKLFTDSFGLTRPAAHPEKVGMNSRQNSRKGVDLSTAKFQDATTGIPLDQQISMAKNALIAMSLTDDFAKFVMIMGHGSSMVNNPHATGYDCGACGGHSGEANAKVAAAVLNNREVRAGLQRENIFIPVDTVFLASLHDTTTDEVSIYNEYDVPDESKADLEELKKSLKVAGHRTRGERSFRLALQNGSDIDKAILSRTKDWSQTRPEWGLAGCSSFVVAPRERTKGIDMGGQAFLHSYDWKADKEFGVLELIMTAPMVVTSWINLQYYGSAVDNKAHGSGNKTLHNVTAGVGVLEGFSGDLRVGLPWQAVHDGENYQHEPVRLNVIIEAPLEAMNNILKKHQSVKDLCDNGWINLLAMDENGKVSHRYEGDFNWDKIN
jgi:uncharacterized protein YbcC (UPF0753/DUF2309 family)